MGEDQLFTWGALASMGGASLLTFLVVQYTKDLIDKVKIIPTDLYAVGVSFIILLVAQLALGASGLDWKIYALSLANGFLVATSAGHIQTKAVNPPKVRKKVTSSESE